MTRWQVVLIAAAAAAGIFLQGQAQLAQILPGSPDHDGRPNCADISPDGVLLAAGCGDKMIRIYDVASGALAREIPTGPWSPLAVAFSPDGLTLASGFAFMPVQIWDFQSGQLVDTLPPESVGHVVYSPDGRLLATQYGGTLSLWDLVSGTLARAIPTQHLNEVWGVDFSPDGRTIATSSLDGTIRLWDPATGTLLQTLAGAAGRVWDIDFSANGLLLAAACDSAIQIWDVTTWTLLRSATELLNVAREVRFSPDGAILASVCFDAGLMLWETRRLALLHSENWPFCNLVFTPDGKMLAALCTDYWSPGGLRSPGEPCSDVPYVPPHAITLWDVQKLIRE